MKKIYYNLKFNFEKLVNKNIKILKIKINLKI